MAEPYFKEIIIDGIDTEVYVDQYVQNDLYTEEQWKIAMQNSIRKAYEAYENTISLFNNFMTGSFGIQNAKYGKDHHDENMKPYMEAMNKLRTVFKYKIIEYILCTNPGWMNDVVDVDWNYSSSLDVFGYDKNGNCINKKSIILDFI